MKMNRNELIKNFYKYLNVAEFMYALKGKLYYAVIFAEQVVMFEVPMSDMGDAKFEDKMLAKYMVRYMVEEKQEENV
jgi:hypothetical protein